MSNDWEKSSYTELYRRLFPSRGTGLLSGMVNSLKEAKKMVDDTFELIEEIEVKEV